MRVKDKVAIITGGGAGIGRATSLLFAREGARVLVVDIDGAKAEEVSREITQQGGVAEAFAEDISTEEGAERTISRAVSLWQRLDILVNNAARFPRDTVENVTRENWEEVWKVNLLGTTFCSKYAVAAMRKHNRGAIVNMGSVNAFLAAPDQMTYNASKAAIISMTKSMAVDVAAYNIRVNCVCPGVTVTPALLSILAAVNMSVAEAEERYVRHSIIKRFAKPEEIAPAILFLASDETSYMTAATVMVDGGLSVAW